jgi:hypothetical protein
LLHGSVELRRTDEAGTLRLRTSTAARFLGATIARSESTTLIDPATGRTREHRSYSSRRGRHYRFGESGYTVDRLRPVGSGEDVSWEVASSETFAYPSAGGADGSAPLFDYGGMLLGLGQQALDAPGDEVTVHVATSRGPRAYRIRMNESRSGRRTFVDLATGETRTLPARESRLTILPADPESEEGLFRMKGDVEIWVEAETKTPLEIAGEVPNVPGTVRLVLAAMG